MTERRVSRLTFARGVAFTELFTLLCLSPLPMLGLLQFAFGGSSAFPNVGGIVFGLVLVCGYVALVVRAVRHIRRPESIRAARRLAASEGAAWTRDAIDREVTHENTNVYGSAFGHGYIALTPRLLVVFGRFRVHLIPRTDLMWLYRERTTQYIYFVVKVSSWERLVVGPRSGALLRFRASERCVQRVLERVAAESPWVALGYSQEMRTLWGRHRAEFVDEVDKRRAQYRTRASRRPRD